MNQFEKQLQSWTPRRPSPKIALRLFGAPAKAAWPLSRIHTWTWLTPLAACALTILIAVHSGSRPYAQLASRGEGAFFATFMFDASSSNLATYSLSQRDENLEWNVWPHAARHAEALPRAEMHSPLEILNLVPTNH
jgi:hypothetical protein